MVTEAGRAAKVRTLAVGYRLAPEHCFPAALDDALTAWRFLRKQGVTAKHIVIAGDSAGGGLTVALINRLRHAGDEQPACAWLVSPWTDLTMSGSTLVSKDAVDPLIHKAYLGELAECLSSRRARPQGSAGFSTLFGFEGISADADPGGIGRDAAR
jgi:acetyl esterase/lipase